MVKLEIVMKLIFHLNGHLDMGHCGNQKYFQKLSNTFSFHQKVEFSMNLSYVRERSKRNYNGSELLECSCYEVNQFAFSKKGALNTLLNYACVHTDYTIILLT